MKQDELEVDHMSPTAMKQDELEVDGKNSTAMGWDELDVKDRSLKMNSKSSTWTRRLRNGYRSR